MNLIKKSLFTSTHWGTYKIKVSKGKVVKLINFDKDKDPSPIGNGILNVLDGPTRIKKPMVRKSWYEEDANNRKNRGKDKFIEIDWNEAENLVAKELKRVINNHGNESIFAGSYGWASAGRFHHAQSQLHRFLNCIGGYCKSVDTYSFAAAEVIIPYIIGDFRKNLYQATNWSSINKHTELFVAFGGIPIKNGQISQGGLGVHLQKQAVIDAKKNGIKFVNISPLREDIQSSVNSEWLKIIPNTDTALILSICKFLIDNNLYDKNFVNKYTEGFDEFKNYLDGKNDGIKKSPEWASSICNIRIDKIKKISNLMAKSRTMISVSWSLTRQDHGEQPFWAAVVLASMLGQIGLPGGGIGFGYSAVNAIGNVNQWLPVVSFPQKNNSIKKFIPVARISDMLLNPNSEYDYNGQKLTYPEIKLIYWAGGNPFHHHQDLKKLSNAWKKPDTVISHEWCWNSLAKNSDIILPCTTTLERNDISISPQDEYIVYMDKAIEPIGSAKNDFQIFSEISKLLNKENEFTEGKSEDEWLKWIYESSLKNFRKLNLKIPTFSQLREMGWFKINVPKKDIIMLKKFRDNPIKNPLNTQSGKIEIFSKQIEKFKYKDCLPHPSWIEPIEWLGKKNKTFPFHLICNQPRTKLHSQLDHGSYSQKNKINGREPIYINKIDAKDKNIKENDLVLVFNKRGACIAGAKITTNIIQGVVLMSTGSWYNPIKLKNGMLLCNNGNPNILTIDKGTSKLAQGPIAHSCLVEIKKFNEILPEVSAYDEPEIIKKKN